MSNRDIELAWAIERNARSLVSDVSKSNFEMAEFRVNKLRNMLNDIEEIIQFKINGDT